MRTAWMLPVVVLLGACASSPKAPESSPPRSAAAPSPAAAAATPSEGEQGELGDITPANIAEAQKAGYKVVNEKGTTMFCKKTLLTGTRLKYVTTCLTAAQWRQTTDEAREGLKDMQGGTWVDSPTNPLGR